jgi:hypothetical protein
MQTQASWRTQKGDRHLNTEGGVAGAGAVQHQDGNPWRRQWRAIAGALCYESANGVGLREAA